MIDWRKLASVAALAAAAALPAKAGEVAPVVHRLAAPEARQGVASDGEYIYAVDNNTIGKYRIADGEKVGHWQGDPALFPHINSCTIVAAELVCAASNHSDVPQLSAIEFFDAASLTHLRTASLGMQPGSLTVVDRHDGKWWAVFANYTGNGGDPARDHTYTLFVQLDDSFRLVRGWGFPPEVLGKFAPKSASGASWGADGRLYVSGHDLPEIYVLALPEAGSVLRLVETIAVESRGQAVDFDPLDEGLLWSIDRHTRQVIASRMAE